MPPRKINKLRHDTRPSRGFLRARQKCVLYFSLYLFYIRFYIRQLPGAIKVRLGRSIKTEIGKPALSRYGFGPVGFWRTCGQSGAEIEIYGPTFKVLFENWRLEYNTVRPHSSLGCRPPAPEAIQPLIFEPFWFTSTMVNMPRILT